jgi:cardiolipin synthase A/B
VSHAIQRSRRMAWLTNPYFLPDARLIHALVSAAKRGVDVRVLVPARSDVPIIDLAARPIFRHLLHRGVRVFQWTRSVLHAKTMVVDRNWASVGSFNIDPASFQNLELNLNIRHDGLAEKMTRMFLDDLGHSGELVPTRVDRSPAHLRIAESMLHGLRHWL